MTNGSHKASAFAADEVAAAEANLKAAQERLENAKLEVIKNKKLKDNMGNVDDAANDNLDDSLLDDNELL